MYKDTKDFWVDDKGLARPRRTGGSGPWSGLKFSVKAQQIPSYVDAKPGLVVNTFEYIYIYVVDHMEN